VSESAWATQRFRKPVSDVRYKCCNHCEFPCPTDGHTKPCMECRPKATGRRKISDEEMGFYTP